MYSALPIGGENSWRDFREAIYSVILVRALRGYLSLDAQTTAASDKHLALLWPCLNRTKSQVFQILLMNCSKSSRVCSRIRQLPSHNSFGHRAAAQKRQYIAHFQFQSLNFHVVESIPSNTLSSNCDYGLWTWRMLFGNPKAVVRGC